MNLHGVASGVISAINPITPAAVRLSSGPAVTADDGSRTPTFETPGEFAADLASDGTLTISAVTAGLLGVGQMIVWADAPASPTVTIQRQITGDAGGIGTYATAPIGIVAASQPMTSWLLVPAQVQSLSGRDLRQIEGLNLQGTMRAIYFYGQVEAIVRATQRGGSLISLPTAGAPPGASAIGRFIIGVSPIGGDDGGSADTNWLVSSMFEQWPDWCKVLCTLQNP